MIRIIRNILITLFWKILFDQINKIDFISFLDSFKNLNTWELFRISRLLSSDTMPENSTLKMLTQTFEIDFHLLVNSWPRKLFLFGFIFTLITNVWLVLFKRILLLPFKLGLFSFIFSILGVDVSWFLNIFNYFPLNIPCWVYTQYLTLYNNWLMWWYNTVNIKSITPVPVKEIKKIKKNIKSDLIETEKPHSNKVWYIVGIVTVVVGIGFILWYFEAFGSNDPGPGANTNITPETSYLATSLPQSNIPNLSSSPSIESVPQIQIINNQTQPTPTSSSSSGNLWDDGNIFPSSQTPASIPDPWGNNGPPSPTGSTDSTDTIKPSSLNSGRPVFLLRRR